MAGLTVGGPPFEGKPGGLAPPMPKLGGPLKSTLKRDSAISSTSSRNGSTSWLSSLLLISFPNCTKPPDLMASGIADPTAFCTMVLLGAIASDIPAIPDCGTPAAAIASSATVCCCAA